MHQRARTDLRRGREVTRVPTATRVHVTVMNRSAIATDPFSASYDNHLFLRR